MIDQIRSLKYWEMLAVSMNENTANFSNATGDDIEEVKSCDVFYFTVNGVFGLLICAIGLIGNALSFWIIKQLDKKSVTFFLLRCLAVVDALYLLFCFIVIVVPEIIFYAQALQYFHSEFQYVYFILFPISSMALTITIWLTCFLTIHRYLKVCRPNTATGLSTKRTAATELGILIFISLIIEIPRYFEFTIEKVLLKGKTYYFLDSTELWDDFTYQLVYKTIAMVVIRRLLPITVTLVLTIQLVRYLHHRRAIRHKMFNSKPKQSGNTVTNVLIIIAISFIICHTPGTIYPIFRITMDIPPYCDHFYTYFSITADMLSVFNSALNFFIYYPAIPSFRKRIRRVLLNCMDSNEVGPIRSSEMFVIDSGTAGGTVADEHSNQ